jgi:hypothetical protein
MMYFAKLSNTILSNLEIQEKQSNFLCRFLKDQGTGNGVEQVAIAPEVLCAYNVSASKNWCGVIHNQEGK